MLEALYYISTDPSHQRQSRVILPSKHRSMDHEIPNPGLVVALPPAWIRVTVLDPPRTKPSQNLCGRCTCCGFLSDTGEQQEEAGSGGEGSEIYG